jgi:serine/threonine protein kinase
MSSSSFLQNLSNAIEKSKSKTPNIKTEEKKEIPDEIPLNINLFSIGKCLGNGQYGRVYLAEDKFMKKKFAIKIIEKKMLNKDYSQLKTEIEIHVRLKHPHIIEMFAYFYDENFIYILFEFASFGSLFDVLKTQKNLINSNKKIFNIIYQISLALFHLKQKKIVHKDIKLENILVTELNENNIKIKLCDFGCATQCFSKKIFQFSKKGTAQYLSPEIVITHKFDYKADVWALGIIIYEILTNGISPFNYENNNKIYDEIKNYTDFKSICEPIKKLHIDEDLFDLMGKMFEKDPNKRINIEEILESKYIVKNLNLYKNDENNEINEFNENKN